jgi:hypothetical protein
MVQAFQQKYDVTEKLGEITNEVNEAFGKSPEEKELVRKIDLYLMPSIWILYLLAVCSLPPSS